MFSNDQVLTTTKGAQIDRQPPSEKDSPHVSYGLKSPVRACLERSKRGTFRGQSQNQGSPFD